MKRPWRVRLTLHDNYSFREYIHEEKVWAVNDLAAVAVLCMDRNFRGEVKDASVEEVK